MRRSTCALCALFLVASAGMSQEKIDGPFSGRKRMGDDDLAQIVSPEKLTSLILRGHAGYGPDSVTDAGIAHLARCTNLRVLHLGGLDLTDRSLATIGKLTSLEELHLDSNEITGDGLRHLVGLKNLRRLDLSFNPLRDDVFETLAKLSELTYLSTYFTGTVDDRVLELCSRLTKLETLKLSERTQAVTDRGLEHVARLKNLKNFELREAKAVTDAGIVRLAELVHLQDVSLRSLRGVTPRGIEVVGKLPELRHLAIDDIPMDDASIRSLASLKKLERLLLWSVAHEPRSLEPLGQLRSLRDFRTNQVVSSAAIRELAKLPDLESIMDELTEVTDEDLTHLARLTKLRNLVLGSDKVTAESLPTLAKMKSLRLLYVSPKVQVAPEQWAQLGDTALTQCQIALFRPPYTVFHKAPMP
jgi:hypothetical protein